MTKNQRELLKLLTEIDEICKKNEIDYFLAGGTLIGAIRHEGFLPWDDDADIHMTRQNYNKFCQIVNDTIENRVVMSKAIDRNFSQPHPRYTAIDNTVMQTSTFATKTPQGQFVDIFILDTVPNGEKKQKRYQKMFELYGELVTEGYIQSSLWNNSTIACYNFLRKAEKIIGKETIYSFFEKKLFSYNENAGEYYHILSAALSNSIFRKEFFGKPQYVKFENTYLPVHAKVEETLFKSYGERWFEIPGLEGRDKHFFVTDYNISYKFYDDYYSSIVDVEKYRKDCQERKDRWFHLLIKRNRVNRKARVLGGIPIIYEISQFVESRNIDLMMLVEEKRYKELSLLFKPLTEYLQIVHIKYWGIVYELPENLVFAALYPMVMQGYDYALARKLLRKYEEKHKLDESLEKLKEYINVTAKLLEELYTNKNYSEVKKIINEFYDQMPENIYFIRANIKILLSEENDRNEKSLNRILDDVDGLIELYEDPELKKYKGDIYWLLGDMGRSAYYYELILSNMTNGLELLDAKHKLAQIGEKT